MNFTRRQVLRISFLNFLAMTATSCSFNLEIFDLSSSTPSPTPTTDDIGFSDGTLFLDNTGFIA